jgi:hypothetical protein
VVPGTSFPITRSFLRVTLNTAEASLGSTDYLFLFQIIEGVWLRELISGGHSISILARSSVANLIFGASFRDSAEAYSLSNLATLGAANTWSLIQLPNLAQWTASGSFPLTPGSAGYELIICLAAGSGVSNAPGSWLNTGNYGANGQSNFAASAVNSTFDLAFVQHEPGTICSTPIDLPFTDNLFASKRYYQKSFPYATRVGTATADGSVSCFNNTPTTTINLGVRNVPEMAKAPATTTYSYITGAANTITDANNGTSPTVTSVGLPGPSAPFINLTVASGLTSGNTAYVQYQADTGW